MFEYDGDIDLNKATTAEVAQAKWTSELTAVLLNTMIEKVAICEAITVNGIIRSTFISVQFILSIFAWNETIPRIV